MEVDEAVSLDPPEKQLDNIQVPLRNQANQVVAQIPVFKLRISRKLSEVIHENSIIKDLQDGLPMDFEDETIQWILKYINQYNGPRPKEDWEINQPLDKSLVPGYQFIRSEWDRNFIIELLQRSRDVLCKVLMATVNLDIPCLQSICAATTASFFVTVPMSEWRNVMGHNQ